MKNTSSFYTIMGFVDSNTNAMTLAFCAFMMLVVISGRFSIGHKRNHKCSLYVFTDGLVSNLRYSCIVLGQTVCTLHIGHPCGNDCKYCMNFYYDLIIIKFINKTIPQNDIVLDTIQYSNWYLMPVDIQRHLKLMIVKAQRTPKLMAGTAELNLMLFVNVSWANYGFDSLLLNDNFFFSAYEIYIFIYNVNDRS